MKPNILGQMTDPNNRAEIIQDELEAIYSVIE
jgi:hypothetical protein